MNITELLDRSGNAKIFFNDSSLTFSELKKNITVTNATPATVYKWSGIWTSHSLQELLSAFKWNLPIVCSANESDDLPPLQPGEVAFRSSGSEGKTKWAIHPYKHFLEGDYLTFKSPAFAFLSPSHAAGFDFLFICLRAGVDFGFADLKSLEVTKVSTLFGPPQAMAGLLFFHKNHKHLFNQLEEYFVSSDPIPNALVEKTRKLNLVCKFRIFYGSSETMVIKVQEHPRQPHLFRFAPGEAIVKNHEVYYEGPTLAPKLWSKEKGFISTSRPFPMGDIINVEDSWLSLQENKRNLVKIWGHSLNLKMVEDDILSLEGIIDTRVEVVRTEILGSHLRIHVWSQANFEKDKILTLPQLRNIQGFCRIEYHSPDEIDVQKKKRILNGKED